jgi:hypothetical protein
MILVNRDYLILFQKPIVRQPAGVPDKKRHTAPAFRRCTRIHITPYLSVNVPMQQLFQKLILQAVIVPSACGPAFFSKGIKKTSLFPEMFLN